MEVFLLQLGIYSFGNFKIGYMGACKVQRLDNLLKKRYLSPGILLLNSIK